MNNLLNVQVLSTFLQHYLVYKLSCNFRKPPSQSPAPGKDQLYNLRYSPKKLLFNLFFTKKRLYWKLCSCSRQPSPMLCTHINRIFFYGPTEVSHSLILCSLLLILSTESADPNIDNLEHIYATILAHHLLIFKCGNMMK